jgi:hypothetical protein
MSSQTLSKTIIQLPGKKYISDSFTYQSKSKNRLYGIQSDSEISFEIQMIENLVKIASTLLS